MIESIGEMELSEANELNIPINIFIAEPGDGVETHDKWELYANNYMPRKEYSCSLQYQYKGDSREELVELIKKYVVPLYETALSKLKSTGELYFWEAT